MRLPFSLKKIHLYLLISILLISVIFISIKIVSPTENKSYHTQLLEQMEHASSFSEFTNALFCYETSCDSITTAYTLKNPSAYQIPKLAPKLSSFSYKQYDKDKRLHSDTKMLSSFSDTLEQFDSSSLSEKEKLTYSLLEKQFDLNKNLSEYSYYESLLGSTTGVQANLPVTLGEYPLRTEKDVQTYLALLKQIPDYFDNVISYETRRETLGYQSSDFLLSATKNNLTSLIKSLNQEENCFIAPFDDRVSQIKELSNKQKTAYQKQNHKYVKKYVLPAYEEIYTYVDTSLSQKKKTVIAKDSSGLDSSTSNSSNALHSDETDSEQTTSDTQHMIPANNTPYGLSTLPNGTDYYCLLVKSSTGSDRPVTELISMTEQSLRQALGDVLNIALTDQTAYLYYCEHPMETYYQSPEAIVEALSLMIREDYPPLAKAPSYRIKTVSDSLASSVSPAFYMIPAIDDYQNNTIYINPLYTNEENGNLFTTLAHEGFPGHLYQTVYFNDTNPDVVRQALNYPGYVEGWATYVEMNSFTFLDYPLEGDSLCRLYQADTIINLALCSRIDMGVNYENWTLADVCTFFEDNGFNSYYAADIYSYVVESPSTYLSYFIGYLEIQELKQRYQQQEMEHYSEKEFHKKFLDIGPSDFTTLEEYMLVNP